MPRRERAIIASHWAHCVGSIGPSRRKREAPVSLIVPSQRIAAVVVASLLIKQINASRRLVMDLKPTWIESTKLKRVDAPRGTDLLLYYVPKSVDR